MSRRGCACLLLLLLPGCDGEGLPGGIPPSPQLNWGPAAGPQLPSAGSDLLGAWFICRDQSCSRIDNEGLFFDGEGRWLLIRQSGSTYDPGQGFCSELGGTYRWDGERLALVDWRGRAIGSFPVEVQLDRARIEAGQESMVLIRVPGQPAGSCDSF